MTLVLDLFSPGLNRLLDTFLDEDLGRGDLTSIIDNNLSVKANLVAKQQGVFCGGPLIERLFQRLDGVVIIRRLVADGEGFAIGQKLLELQGPAMTLLAGERTALNLAMHLSGIATATASLVAQLEGTPAKYADTRKTTPGLRILEKYAVRCGGGVNHRLGLDDAAMLKENHIAWSGGIEPAVRALQKTIPWPSRLIVEAETSMEAEEAARLGVDGVLLDEFSPVALKALVPKLRELALLAESKGGPGRIVLEASGVDSTNLKQYAFTGVDFISSSASITKSTWIDISMRFDKNV